MFHHNLMYFRFIAHSVINVQIIDPIVQMGHIQMRKQLK